MTFVPDLSIQKQNQTNRCVLLQILQVLVTCNNTQDGKILEGERDVGVLSTYILSTILF